MAESAGEKTFAPTPKRLREAAKNGDVLRSRELAVAGSVLLAGTFLKMAGPWLFTTLTDAMRLCLQWDRAAIDDFNPGRLLLTLGAAVMPPVLSLGFAVILLTLITQLGPTADGHFIFENLAPKSSRINPMNGLSRMFGTNGWIEVGKGLLKVTLLGALAYSWARTRVDGLMQLGAVGLSGQLDFAWHSLISLLFQLGAGLMGIAMIDFPVQWIRRMKRLRMTLQEVRDESKEQEGSPEAKAKRRQRQRAIAMGAIMGAMQKAQFVVTNPTHFAVAMTYDPDLAPAPVVLAKGRGEKALAIRELAAANELPCLEYPGLARALYYTTRENQVIREELFIAVAGVLAFVMSIRRGEARPAPEISVPVSMRFDAEGRPDPDDLHQSAPE